MTCFWLPVCVSVCLCVCFSVCLFVSPPPVCLKVNIALPDRSQRTSLPANSSNKKQRSKLVTSLNLVLPLAVIQLSSAVNWMFLLTVRRRRLCSLQLYNSSCQMQVFMLIILLNVGAYAVFSCWTIVFMLASAVKRGYSRCLHLYTCLCCLQPWIMSAFSAAKHDFLLFSAVVRGCAAGFERRFPQGIPTRGCHRAGGEVWCFCARSGCNRRDMENFITVEIP